MYIRECPTHSIRNHYAHIFVLGLLYLNFDMTRVIQRGANSRSLSRPLIQVLFIFSYKVKTKTPIVYGSVFNVRALKEAHRILKFNYISINYMIPLEIDVHRHIIVVNIFKIDPAVCLNKTSTHCYIQYTFATLSYTQLKEE